MFDMDFVERGMKPSPPSAEAISAMDELGPGDYEIFSEKLNIICEEGKKVMSLMGISSMLHSGDTMAGVYTADGDLVTAACGTYLHVVTGQVPVFKDGAIVSWAVVGAHQSETGGKEPGGEVTTAVSRHDEGMKLTPIKIGENFKLKTDLLMMMENFMSRAPRMQTIDVKARVAACDRIRQRVQEIAEQQGERFLMGLFQKMITESEVGARKRISEWNDGTYRHVVFIDTTGVEASLLRVPLALHKKGDRITIDLTGTSPEHEGSFQTLAPCVRGHCCVNLYQGPFHDFPISAGTMEPIDFEIPHGTIMDPDPEAVISCSPVTASAVFPLLAVAMSKMMYDSGVTWSAGSPRRTRPPRSSAARISTAPRSSISWPSRSTPGGCRRAMTRTASTFSVSPMAPGARDRTWRTSKALSRCSISTRRACPTAAASASTAAAPG
jgi:acetophenone carboxylase